MYNYTTTTYLGYKIHIITAKTDSSENVQLSVMANHYSSTAKALAINFHDTSLENAGWVRRGIINGGLFFTENNIHYANGIERAYGITNENDDSSLNTVMAFAHSGNTSNAVVLNTQINIAASLGSYRGAITGAFGLLRNGSIDQGATNLQGNYSSKSGRSIIGNKEDGTIYFISVAGVTGSSGLTGAECLSFVQSLGLYNAIAMDGGGSVSLISDDDWKIPTVTTNARLIKNTVAIYTKAIVPTPTPITPPASTAELPAPKKGTTAVNRMYFGANKVNKIIRIDPANQNQLTVYRDTIISANFPQEFGTSYTWSNLSSTNSQTNMTSTNNQYITSFTASNKDGTNPGTMFWSNPSYSTNTGSNGQQAVTYTVGFNARVSFQSMTIDGWGQNHAYLSSPASGRVEGSTDGTNWTILFNGIIPNSWTGSNIHYTDAVPSETTQMNDFSNPGVRDANVSYTGAPYYINGPGAQTLSLAYNNYYFRFIRFTFYTNYEQQYYGTTNGLDRRFYWDKDRFPNIYQYFTKSFNISVKKISFNAKIQPL